MKSLAAALILLFSAVPVLAEELGVLSDMWCPYSCLPGNRPGYMIETAKAIFEPKGLAVDYKLVPWEEGIRLVAAGKEDALAGCSKIETPGLIFPDSPIGMSGTAVFVQSTDSWNYRGVESLKSIRLAVSFGYDYGEAVNAYIRDNPDKVSVAKSAEPIKESLRSLSLGHVDAVLGDPNVVLMTAGSMGMMGRIRSAGNVQTVVPIYLAFNPMNDKSPALAKQFDEGMAALRASGKLDAILAKYGLTDWEKAR